MVQLSKSKKCIQAGGGKGRFKGAVKQVKQNKGDRPKPGQGWNKAKTQNRQRVEKRNLEGRRELVNRRKRKEGIGLSKLKEGQGLVSKEDFRDKYKPDARSQGIRKKASCKNLKAAGDWEGAEDLGCDMDDWEEEEGGFFDRLSDRVSEMVDDEGDEDPERRREKKGRSQKKDRSQKKSKSGKRSSGRGRTGKGGKGAILVGVFPILFFLVYFIWHKLKSDKALDQDKRDGVVIEKDAMEKLWLKFSVKEKLFMIGLSLIILWIGGGFAASVAGGEPMMWGGRLWALIMVVTATISIFMDDGRGGCYGYFDTELWPDAGDKFKDTCISWGCGYHPHIGDGEAERGADVDRS